MFFKMYKYKFKVGQIVKHRITGKKILLCEKLGGRYSEHWKGKEFPSADQGDHIYHSLLYEAELEEVGIDMGSVSDGYHTFDELYAHRHELWIALCRSLAGGNIAVWRSMLHSDGTSYDGWFVLGCGVDAGQQVTYHLPIERWDECNFAETLEKAHEYDGHTSDDVLVRLKALNIEH